MEAQEQMEPKEEGKDHSWGCFLRSFFHNYLWLGLVFILAAIIADQLAGEEGGFILSVLIKAVESVGIAIVVASLFTFASGTSRFIAKIRALLEDIVVSRDFLNNIDSRSKREALRSMLKPSSSERGLYSNIDDYYETYITQTMSVVKKSVRSNYCVNCRAYVDGDTGKVAVVQDVSYRLYPNVDGYQNIRCLFYDYDNASLCNHVIVNKPDGSREVFDGNLEKQDGVLAGEKIREFTVNLMEIGKGFSHLDIELRLSEYGEGHWILFTFQTLQPTDGFRLHLRCEDGLTIKKHDTFIHGTSFYVDEAKPGEIIISCNQWVNEGTGIAMVIARAEAQPAEANELVQPTS